MVSDLRAVKKTFFESLPTLKISPKGDVWSLGCILYCMTYGKTPFQSITNQIAKLHAIIDPSHKIEFPDISEKDLLDVLKVRDNSYTALVVDFTVLSCVHTKSKISFHIVWSVAEVEYFECKRMWCINSWPSRRTTGPLRHLMWFHIIPLTLYVISSHHKLNMFFVCTQFYSAFGSKEPSI